MWRLPSKLKKSAVPQIRICWYSNNYGLLFTFLNPISCAYSLKHCLQMFSPYLRIRPCRLEQARLKRQKWYLLKTRVITKHPNGYTFVKIVTNIPWTRSLSVSTGMRVPNVCVTHLFIRFSPNNRTERCTKWRSTNWKDFYFDNHWPQTTQQWAVIDRTLDSLTGVL